MIITLYDRETTEILAMIDTTGKTKSVCRNDVDFKIYDETEPIVKASLDGKVYLDGNKFIMRPYNKCPCYDCKHFEKEGWSHCKIHEWANGDSRCSDYEE